MDFHFSASINNSEITAGRWGASTQKTVLKRVGIEFWDSNPVPAILNYATVLALNHIPKDLKWQAPIYSDMNGFGHYFKVFHISALIKILVLLSVVHLNIIKSDL